MVVLTEEFHGLSLKRKGAYEPGLFDGADDRSSGLSLPCRATKMRRLSCPDGPSDGDDQTVTAASEDDVAMGDAAPSHSPGTVGGDERAVVVYGDGSSSRRIDAPRLALRAGVDADWIRVMFREANSRTVRELLAGAALERRSEPDLALAVVPWVAVAPTTAEETAEASTAVEAADDGADGEGAAAMDVEQDEVQEGGRPWTGQDQAYDAAVGEELVYRWPQHCWASPMMWSC
jgi:hypothetical protein